MTLPGRLLRGALLWLAAGACAAQPVTATVSPVPSTAAAPVPRGQLVIDITTLTAHPAYLEPQSLKTPDGVRVLASTAAPDNGRTCARSAASRSECRQVFRVTLDAGARCHAGGEYEALFRVSCWPGTAASLCKPGAYQHDFKLDAAQNLCRP